MRGWIDPDDRLWRHPSERRPSRPDRAADGYSGPASSRTGAPGARVAVPWLICGSLFVALIVAAACVIVADTGETTSANPSLDMPHSAPTTEPGSSRLTSADDVDAVVAGVRPSTVAVDVTDAEGTATVTGLVVESGGIIVTTARALAGAKRITVIEPDGSRQPADLVGTDQRSDLAALRIDDDLPAVTFDDDDPAAGSVAMAVAMRPSTTDSEQSPLVYAGTVVSSGMTVDADAVTATFAATSVRAPLDDDDLGCPLVDSQGHVLGLLELTTHVGASDVSVFLPSTLVAGVARQLVSSGTVDHGWLGVQGTTPAPAPMTTTATASHSAGAVLASVVKDSPAALAGLDAGDVVTAVDGAPVHSMPDFMTRLYPDPPGTTIAVTFERSNITETTQVQLADPAAETTGATSP